MLRMVFKISPVRRIGTFCYVAGTSEADALYMINILVARNIGIISDYLGEAVGDRMGAIRAARKCIHHIRTLGALKIRHPNFRLAVSVKLSQYGLAFNPLMAGRILKELYIEAMIHGIGLEIDIEGPETIDATLRTLARLLRRGSRFRVAIPVNQSRAEKILEFCLRRGIAVRIIKGAYPGDIVDRDEINKRFIEFVHRAHAQGLDTALGTHDLRRILKPLLTAFPHARIQMLFGIRVFLQEKLARTHVLSVYLPWGEESGKFFSRRLDEGMRPEVLPLFVLNFFESLMWRLARTPRSFLPDFCNKFK